MNLQKVSMQREQTTINMRKHFTALVHARMQQNTTIWVITGDLGYGLWDKVRTDFPERFVNTGAAEQSMIGIAVGLALQGKIPLVYSITPFLLYRPFETIRNYLAHERIPVKLFGSGRDKEYVSEGFSHWAEEDRAVLQLFSSIRSFWPESVAELNSEFDELITNKEPWYVNLKR